MKRKSLIVAVMVLVLLCASSVCVALAYSQCDHDGYSTEERFTTESSTACSNDSSCTVTTTNTWYDFWCGNCRTYIGYEETYYEAHTGVHCENVEWCETVFD